MADWIAEIGKELLKLALHARYSFAVRVLALLILTGYHPAFLKLDRIRDEFGQWIGATCLGAFILWVVEISIYIYEQVKGLYLVWREKHKTLEQLDSLSHGEATILLRYIQQGSQTDNYMKDSNEANSLVQKKLLIMVAVETRYESRPFTVPRFVWKHINKEKIRELIQSKIRVV
jgi:hypothetical protein